jgi:hypothetical protein
VEGRVVLGFHAWHEMVHLQTGHDLNLLDVSEYRSKKYVLPSVDSSG